MEAPKPDIVFTGVPEGEYPDDLPLTSVEFLAFERVRPESSVLVHAVNNKLPSVRARMLELPTLGQDFHLDIVLQTHPLGFMGEDVTPEEDAPLTKWSQQKIYEFLLQAKPTTLGLEGFWGEVTKSNLIRAMRAHGIPRERTQHVLAIEEYKNAGVRYALKRAYVNAFGFEDPDVVQLHSEMWCQYPEGVSSDFKFCVQVLRSIIALHRTIEVARASSVSTATLIIGAGHLAEIEALMKGAGIPGQVFDLSGQKKVKE